jgi:hypothetical protein
VASVASKPPKLATIRKIALSLPQAEEVTYKGAPWFNIGSKSFALYWPKEEGRWIFKLPKPQQMMLFDTRPKTFSPMRAGKMVWSYVNVEDLDSAELKDLLTAAWRTIAPKKLQKETRYLEPSTASRAPRRSRSSNR